MTRVRVPDPDGVHRRSALLPVLGMAMALSCRGPMEPAPLRRPPEPAAAAASGGSGSLARRQAARDIEALRLQVENDRQTCALGEQQVGSLRSLVLAGRAADTELASAEAELLQQVRNLHDREQALAAALAEFSAPSAARTIRIGFESPALPDWRIEDGNGNTVVARQFRVGMGRVVRLVLTADRECSLEIPALRVRARAVPDRQQTAWFVPVEPGEYAVLVRSSAGDHDGKLIVTADEVP